MGLIDTLADLVRINSVNPAYPGGRPETEVQDYVASFLARAGIESRRQPTELPGRYNLVAVLPGRDAGRRIVFEAHCDTAGIEGMTIEPFVPHIRAGRLHGRGSCDVKGGLAAMLHAFADLAASGRQPASEVWFVSAVDEEHAYRGAAAICKNLVADAAVIAEPTDLRLIAASKGCVRWRTIVTGRAAHSSRPELGINAIDRAARLILEMAAPAQWRDRCHPLVGPATQSVGMIQGGTQVNIVPERCWFDTDRRLVPGEDPATALAEFQALVDRLRRADPDLACATEVLLEDWPLDTPTDAAIVSQAAGVQRRHGLDSEPRGVAFGSDASKFSRAGIPAIVYGPGSIAQAHAADEFIELAQVEAASRVYRDLME